MAASDEPICPRYVGAVRLLGKRWTALIVHVLLAGPQRFGAIAAAITVLSDRVLAERLRELEAAGVIRRQIDPQNAGRVEYALTAKGRDLETVVRELHRWAHRWDDHCPTCAPLDTATEESPAPHAVVPMSYRRQRGRAAREQPDRSAP